MNKMMQTLFYAVLLSNLTTEFLWTKYCTPGNYPEIAGPKDCLHTYETKIREEGLMKIGFWSTDGTCPGNNYTAIYNCTNQAQRIKAVGATFGYFCPHNKSNPHIKDPLYCYTETSMLKTCKIREKCIYCLNSSERSMIINPGAYEIATDPKKNGSATYQIYRKNVGTLGWKWANFDSNPCPKKL